MNYSDVLRVVQIALGRIDVILAKQLEDVVPSTLRQPHENVCYRLTDTIAWDVIAAGPADTWTLNRPLPAALLSSAPRDDGLSKRTAHEDSCDEYQRPAGTVST